MFPEDPRVYQQAGHNVEKIYRIDSLMTINGKCTHIHTNNTCKKTTRTELHNIVSHIVYAVTVCKDIFLIIIHASSIIITSNKMALSMCTCYIITYRVQESFPSDYSYLVSKYTVIEKAGKWVALLWVNVSSWEFLEQLYGPCQYFILIYWQNKQDNDPETVTWEHLKCCISVVSLLHLFMML